MMSCNPQVPFIAMYKIFIKYFFLMIMNDKLHQQIAWGCMNRTNPGPKHVSRYQQTYVYW